MQGRPAKPVWKRVLPALVAAAAVIGLGFALDRWAFEHLIDLKMRQKDWYQQLRQLGSVIPWLMVAACMGLTEFERARRGLAAGRPWPSCRHSRGTLLALSVLAGGALAEALKLVFGRLRPEDAGIDYAYWPIADRIAKWSDCGIPSSHTAVAFAAAAALWVDSRLAGLLVALLACGTGWTRVVNANHYLSDVAAGAVVGVVAAQLVAWLLRRGRAVPELS